jgi:RES domain-containing protein
VTLARQWADLLDELAGSAGEFAGEFFRSVELRYGHPDKVIDGEGTKRAGGRFVRRGTRAVYMSLDEETALREATARKARLGGRSQIQLKDYPRMTFVIAVRLLRCADLRGLKSDREGAELLKACSTGELEASQAVGQYLFDRGVQGIVFPSVVCEGANLVVCRDVKPAGVIDVPNRDEIVGAIRALANEI